MATTLKLQIVTPEGIAYSQDVEMVTLPGIEGQLGILPDHMPIMTQMVPGEMIVHHSGRDELFAVGGGLVEITGDHVSIVTDMALAADKIDEARVEEARQRAAARLNEKLSAEEIAATNAAMARSLAQLSVKRRQRGSRA
jgi:F-type H+-transporting ATPase subunit epsilon